MDSRDWPRYGWQTERMSTSRCGSRKREEREHWKGFESHCELMSSSSSSSSFPAVPGRRFKFASSHQRRRVHPSHKTTGSYMEPSTIDPSASLVRFVDPLYRMDMFTIPVSELHPPHVPLLDILSNSLRRHPTCAKSQRGPPSPRSTEVSS